MRTYQRRNYPQPKTDILAVRGWPRGMSTLVNANQIRVDELAEAVNVAYSQYGVLSKRLGTSLVVTLPGPLQGFGVLNRRDESTGALTKYFCAVAGGKFYTIDPIAKTYTEQLGATFHATNRVVMEQAGNELYIVDGANPLRKWNGTAFSSFTPITKPTGEAVSKVGSGTGTKTYSYVITATNDVGETEGSGAVQLTSMPNKLDTDTYASLSWSPVVGATSYNIYRGSAGRELYLTTVTETSFFDQGQADAQQSTLVNVPEENTTLGPIFTTLAVYHDSILGVDKDVPHRLWYSAGGDKRDSFSTGDGGGFYDFHPENGEAINGVKVFAALGTDAAYLFSDHHTASLKFDVSGALNVSDINLAVGASSDASIVLFENDLAFWSRYGLYTLRQEPNFVNILRISELSIRVHPTLVSPLEPSAIGKICGIYDKDHHTMIFSVPLGSAANSTSIAYDPVYLGFSEYRGIQATAFCRFVDTTNTEGMYGGREDGKVFRLFDGTSDLEEPIKFRAATKVFDMDAPYAYKYFLKAFFFFGNVNARNVRVSLIQDGVETLKDFSIATDAGVTGWGADFWGDVLWGDSSGSPVATNARSVLKYVDLFKDLFSIQVVYENESVSDTFEILSQYFLWQSSDKPLPPSMRIA